MAKQILRFTTTLLLAFLIVACTDPQEKAEAYLESGNGFLESGNLTSAEIEFKNHELLYNFQLENDTWEEVTGHPSYSGGSLAFNGTFKKSYTL